MVSWTWGVQKPTVTAIGETVSDMHNVPFHVCFQSAVRDTGKEQEGRWSSVHATLFVVYPLRSFPVMLKSYENWRSVGVSKFFRAHRVDCTIFEICSSSTSRWDTVYTSMLRVDQHQHTSRNGVSTIREAANNESLMFPQQSNCYSQCRLTILVSYQQN